MGEEKCVQMLVKVKVKGRLLGLSSALQPVGG
jgi:hypothetical protein